MKRKIAGLILSLVIMVSLAPVIVSAEDTISAPQYLGVTHYTGDFFCPVYSAPEDLRAFIERTEPKPSVAAQLDYKLGDGSWHYTGDWDTAPFQVPNIMGFSYTIDNQMYITTDRRSLISFFPEDADALQSIKDSGWNFPDKALSFRVRFVIPRDGNKYIFSDWSDTYVYSRDVAEDPDKLINHSPKLISARLEKHSDGMPYVKIFTDRIPGECQYLNAITGSGMSTEIWMRRAGEKEFKLINTSTFSSEIVQISVSDFFDKAKDSYDAEAYEIKIRYALNDLKKYPQCGRSDIIYSPFSNLFSQNMPAWSAASQWATAELAKADELGLITDSLRGADMTRPITREEFAELAVKLYEKVTGRAAAANSANPFTDTGNPEILKAYRLGITQGTSATTFEPKELTNREQVATMLSRAIRVMVPGADFSTQGAPTFTDQDQISSWAVEHVKFMSKAGIIKGTDEKFMPKAVTTAQQASGYATTTREQAIAMSVRIYERFGQAGGSGSSSPSPDSQGSPALSNTVLKENIEKLNSYRRIVRTVTATAGINSKGESIKEFAYIRNPLSRYIKLDYPDRGSFSEETIINGKCWDRMSKDEKWTEWQEWQSEKPLTFTYDLSTQLYPIDYGKLKYTQAGTEKINGINCIKYDVSGTYSDEFTFEYSTQKYPITLSASGTIWIADDPAIMTAIIRQRITVITDITTGTDRIVHTEDTIEDDVFDVNSAVISAPTDVKKL